MLNTIYEEFDFESKIKDLKNKKIKIKRIVRPKNIETKLDPLHATQERLQPTS